MTLQVDVATNGLRVALSRDRVASLARWVLRKENVREAELSVTFLDARAMASLNRRHLGHSGPTDVIAFEFARTHPNAPLAGDIYICPEVARGNAATHGTGVREELARLVVHGTLHVLGHEHPEGPERATSPMWQRQEELLAGWLKSRAA
jgi:probable rRNA maturation factor